MKGEKFRKDIKKIIIKRYVDKINNFFKKKNPNLFTNTSEIVNSNFLRI